MVSKPIVKIRSGGRLILTCAMLLALACGIAVGQETTGGVTGTVVDASGAAIPNAKVEISGGVLTKALTETTGANGSYTAAQVPLGSYVITVTAPGFSTMKKTGVPVSLGKVSRVDFKMEVGQVTESVVVNAEAVMVDTSSSSTAINVDKSFFDLLPKGRSFYDLVGIAPGARSEGKSGGYQVDGASGAENTYYLDGMEMEDIQGGTLSGQNRVPVEMVQQVQVKNGIMDAQYGGAMGGVISAVLRSGQNDFHGQAGFYYTGDGLTARPRPTLELSPLDDNKAIYFQNPQDTFNNWNPVFNVGGPIVRNRLFFFLGYMPQLNYTDRTVVFNTGQTGTYSSYFKQQYFNSKVDFIPTSKLHVNMSWIFNPNKTVGSLPATDGTSAFDNDWAHQGNFTGGNVLAGQADYLATSKLILSFRAGHTYTNFNNLYATPSTTAIYYSGDSATLPPPDLQGPNGWVNQAISATKYDMNTRTNLNADASYMFNWHGQHSLKGGWQMNKLANDVLTSSYANGYYRYYWGRTYHCQTQVCAETGAYGYYRYRVLGTIGGASSNNQALFLQDNWRVNKHLSLNIGIRTEHEFVPSFTSSGASSSPAITFNWPQKMSPRIGVAWDPKGDGKQRVYGGFGWFYDIMKYSLPRGSFGGDVWKEYYYTLDDPTLVTKNQGFASNPTGLPGKLIETVDYRIPSNDPSQHLIDPNLKPMKQQMIDLGYDYSINSTMVASVRFTDRRLISTIEDIGYVSPDGEVYNIGNPGYGVVANPANWLSWMGPGVPATPKAVRDYDAVELRLDKRFSKSYQFSLSYTWSRLYGNFSGLASSDEGGRDSPNNSRYFDQPWIYGDAHGKNAMGLLPTDRPSTLKFFGGYTLRSKLGATTLSPNLFLYSGTPLTSQVQLIDTQGWVYYDGRGDMGRTPAYFQTDFNIIHDLIPLRSHESFKMRFEFSVFNLFNSSIITDKYNLYSHTIDGAINVDSIASIFSQGVDVKSLMSAQGIRVDPQYGLSNGFQGPRSARIQLSFFF